MSQLVESTRLPGIQAGEQSSDDAPRRSADALTSDNQRLHRSPALAGQPRVLLLAMLPIGDTIWLAPTVRAIRAQYPFAHVTALTYKDNATLAAGLPGVDDTLIFTPPTSPAKLIALLRLIGDIRSRDFDWAVTFTSPGFKFISLLAGIPRRTYMKFDPLWWLIPGRHDRWRATHATQHYYNVARDMGLPQWHTVDQRPTFALPPNALAEADRLLAQHASALDGHPIVAVHPGGAGLSGRKRWPADRYAALILELWRRFGARALIVGGADERALAEDVARMASDASPIVAAGETSLLGAFALVARATLFIGNDSSLLHAAAALGVPYIGIFGPTSPASFRPIPQYARQGRLLLPHGVLAEPVAFIGGDVIWRGAREIGACHALESISVDEALAAAAEALSRVTAPRESASPAE